MNLVEFLQARLDEEKVDLLAEKARLGSRVFGKSAYEARVLVWVQRKALLDAYVMYPDDFPRALHSLLPVYADHPSFDQTWLSS